MPCTRVCSCTVRFLGAADHGDEVTIDGALYTVFEVLNDSAGGCWLSIREKT